MAVIFKHDIGELHLRLNPTLVEWTYNLNTSVTNTYGGQVIQLLSINFDQLILEGQFGKEGPHGKIIQNGLLSEPSVEQFTNLTSRGKYSTGLVQMYSYFQTYFAAASQGQDHNYGVSYDPTPVTVIYDGGIGGTVGTIPNAQNDRTWQVYPVDFPSFSRAVEEFAPKWRVVCEVEQPDPAVTAAVSRSEIDRLRAQVGYTSFSPFSDPIASLLPDEKARENEAKRLVAANQYNNIVDKVFDHFGSFLPEMTPSDLNNILANGSSLPQIFQQALTEAQQQNTGAKLKVTPSPNKSQDSGSSSPSKTAFNHREIYAQ